MEKKVCFIGHRNVPDTAALREKIRETVGRLITEEKVTCFLFGSRSAFDSLCHDVVTELQEAYPAIRRVVYTCRHECATMKEDKAAEEQAWSRILKRPVRIRDYDAEYEHPTKYIAGKAGYVERNQAMINDSDICVFYFDDTSLPARRKGGSDFLPDRQPKSGTAVAYKYAVQKKKVIISLCGTTAK